MMFPFRFFFFFCFQQCLTSDDIASAIVYSLTAPSYVNVSTKTLATNTPERRTPHKVPSIWQQNMLSVFQVATVMIRPTAQRH